MREKILDCLDVLNRMTVTGRANCWAVAAVCGTLEDILKELETGHQEDENILKDLVKVKHQEDEGDG